MAYFTIVGANDIQIFVYPENGISKSVLMRQYLMKRIVHKFFTKQIAYNS